MGKVKTRQAVRLFGGSEGIGGYTVICRTDGLTQHAQADAGFLVKQSRHHTYLLLIREFRLIQMGAGLCDGSAETIHCLICVILLHSDEIADIEHAIEFKTVNAAQGYQLMAELKKARRKRREAKDAKFLIEIAMSHRNNNDWGHSRLETAIEQLDTRQFTPKVRNDLFEKN